MSSTQPNNLLVAKEFTIIHDGLAYKIKASATFLSAGFGPGEFGHYTVAFDSSKGEFLEWTQPDHETYSRAEAKDAVESLFACGGIQRYIESKLQVWIFLHGLIPYSVNQK
jgi:hypothetical protein